MSYACNDVREHASAYLDGELGSDPAAAVDAHVASCAACRADLARLRRTVTELRDVFHEVVRDAPGAPGPGTLGAPARRSFSRVHVLVAAALVAASVVAFALTREPSAPTRSPAAELAAAARRTGTTDAAWSGTTQLDERSVRFHWEPSPERVQWSVTTDGRNDRSGATLAGGNDGREAWLYVPGSGVYRSTSADRWLPEGAPDAWPDHLAPALRRFFDDLEHEAHDVVDVERDADSTRVVVRARPGSAWSTATVVVAGSDGQERAPALSEVELVLADPDVEVVRLVASRAPTGGYTYATIVPPGSPVHPLGLVPTFGVLHALLRPPGDVYEMLKKFGYLGYDRDE
jgi:hypothetical protein